MNWSVLSCKSYWIGSQSQWQRLWRGAVGEARGRALQTIWSKMSTDVSSARTCTWPTSIIIFNSDLVFQCCCSQNLFWICTKGNLLKTWWLLSCIVELPRRPRNKAGSIGVKSGIRLYSSKELMSAQSKANSGGNKKNLIVSACVKNIHRLYVCCLCKSCFYLLDWAACDLFPTLLGGWLGGCGFLRWPESMALFRSHIAMQHHMHVYLYMYIHLQLICYAPLLESYQKNKLHVCCITSLKK